MYKLLLMLAALALVGCDSGTKAGTQSIGTQTRNHEAAVPEVPANAHASIEWFGGTIEQAFSLADTTSKPLFLYWGAVWCPPCQEIKHTVFKSREFIQLTHLFVPVYLDGDTDRAQEWGEKFGVLGYPTMIVFNPAGEEMTRIPGGIDISRYNSVLEVSLNQMRSTADLVQVALNDASQLTPDEFYQLAYYSWFQDTSAVPEGTDKADMFLRLAARAPQGELSTRFFMSYLMALYESHESQKSGSGSSESGVVAKTLPEADPTVVRRLEMILASPALTLTSWDTLAYNIEEILALSVIAEDQKPRLGRLWADSVFALRFDKSLSKTEKLAGWFPVLYVETANSQPLGEDLKNILLAEMQAADEMTPDSYERQTVINQMGYVYRAAGLNEEARRLLLAELEKSASPYYFMSGLGSMAEKSGNVDEALDWRKRAYENSVGEATRFQWGTNYVLTMIRISPDQHEAIERQAVDLLSEFDDARELFAGRNFRSLRRLNEKLQAWQNEQGHTAHVFEAEVGRLCDSQADESRQQLNCRSLFAEKTAVEKEVQSS